MKIENVEFCITDWSKITATEHLGEAGTSFWRTFEEGNIRVRIVEYSPGFLADHWCSLGHILLVLDGELVVELDDGRRFELTTGMSFQVADNDSPHRTRSEKGAKLFIVD